jgi:hypothetical protein
MLRLPLASPCRRRGGAWPRTRACSPPPSPPRGRCAPAPRPSPHTPATRASMHPSVRVRVSTGGTRVSTGGTRVSTGGTRVSTGGTRTPLGLLATRPNFNGVCGSYRLQRVSCCLRMPGCTAACHAPHAAYFGIRPVPQPRRAHVCRGAVACAAALARWGKGASVARLARAIKGVSVHVHWRRDGAHRCGTRDRGVVQGKQALARHTTEKVQYKASGTARRLECSGVLNAVVNAKAWVLSRVHSPWSRWRGWGTCPWPSRPRASRSRCRQTPAKACVGAVKHLPRHASVPSNTCQDACPQVRTREFRSDGT